MTPRRANNPKAMRVKPTQRFGKVFFEKSINIKKNKSGNQQKASSNFASDFPKN